MATYERRADGWSVRWRDPDGTSRRRQVPDAAARDELARDIERAHAAGRRWEPVSRGDPTLQEVTAAYLREQRRIWRPNTYESADISLSLFESWTLDRIRRKHVGLNALSRSLLGAWWDHLRDERGVRVVTANVRVRAVERWWAWCWDHEEYGAATPRPRPLQLPAHEVTLTRAPTWADMDAVIDSLPSEHYRRLAVLARCTGLRKSQLFGLRRDDADIEAGLLTVRPELGKSRQERSGRIVPLAPVLVAELRTWAPGSHLLEWPNQRREAHPQVLERAWTRSGVDPARWRQRTAHAFRKGFVTGLIEAGASREAVEHLVGHAAGLRGIYTDPRALRLAEAVALVPALRVRGASGGLATITPIRAERT